MTFSFLISSLSPFKNLATDPMVCCFLGVTISVKSRKGAGPRGRRKWETFPQPGPLLPSPRPAPWAQPLAETRGLRSLPPLWWFPILSPSLLHPAALSMLVLT